MLAWRHCGFSAHNAVRVPAEDAKGRTKLAGYMLRAPMWGVASFRSWPFSGRRATGAKRPKIADISA
jgi:hypothetical protein